MPQSTSNALSATTMMRRNRGSRSPSTFVYTALMLLVVLLLASPAHASVGDRLPEFRECVEVCERENCGPDVEHKTPIPLHHRLLLWTCEQECDYTCQHIITHQRTSSTPPQPVVQFHGKWPFHRLWGMQEPFSVFCSLLNLWAHYNGLYNRLLPNLPSSYSLLPFYTLLAKIGMATWLFSAIFHTRDFPVTETLDYLTAGASVMYGLYYTPIRVFRLDKPTPRRRSVLRAWTATCAAMYIAHVAYLLLVRWDYGYNMAANVACGIVQNALWSWFSFSRWKESGRMWTVWPGLVVAWVVLAMSLELLDFPPWWGAVDAHSLWHAGTVAPTVLFYNFLVKDAQDDMAGSERLKL